MIDYDTRLVDLYDADNPDGPDHEFYRALAQERGARSILDLGCGTGILTVTLAEAGCTVVGVDPSAAMLSHARRRPGGDAVTWVLGDWQSIPERSFDLAVMTGNVAQHILEPAWAQTLRALRRRLAPGGTVAFESRNPAARAWESWASAERTIRDTVHGTLLEWSEATALADDMVELTFHNLFQRTGDTVTETLRLAFRTRAVIEADLQEAGFEVEAVYGDWNRTPMTVDASVMVFVAHAR